MIIKNAIIFHSQNDYDYAIKKLAPNGILDFTSQFELPKIITSLKEWEKRVHTVGDPDKIVHHEKLKVLMLFDIFITHVWNLRNRLKEYHEDDSIIPILTSIHEEFAIWIGKYRKLISFRHIDWLNWEFANFAMLTKKNDIVYLILKNILGYDSRSLLEYIKDYYNNPTEVKFMPELHIITFHTRDNPPESIYQDLADERIEFHAIYRGMGESTLGGFYEEDGKLIKVKNAFSEIQEECKIPRIIEIAKQLFGEA